MTTIGAIKQLRICPLCNRIGLEPNVIWPRTCFSARLISRRGQRCIRPILRGAILNEKKASRETDLDRLSRLKALSWLSPSELKLLVSALSLTNYKPHALILRDIALAQGAHILLSGIARITCRNARNERVTIALLAPRPIPDFPALPLSQSGFQCEAYNDCRVGTDFGGITPNAPDSAFRQFHSNDLKQWYRLLLRSSTFLNLGLVAPQNLIRGRSPPSATCPGANDIGLRRRNLEHDPHRRPTPRAVRAFLQVFVRTDQVLRSHSRYSLGLSSISTREFARARICSHSRLACLV
jgi:hypothetical protein